MCTNAHHHAITYDPARREVQRGRVRFDQAIRGADGHPARRIRDPTDHLDMGALDDDGFGFGHA